MKRIQHPCFTLSYHVFYLLCLWLGMTILNLAIMQMSYATETVGKAIETTSSTHKVIQDEKKILQIVKVDLANGETFETFVKIDGQIAAYQATQKGFISRQSAHSAQTGWLLLSYWQSEADAERAMHYLMNSPVGNAFINAVEEHTMHIEFYEVNTVKQMQNPTN